MVTKSERADGADVGGAVWRSSRDADRPATEDPPRTPSVGARDRSTRSADDPIVARANSASPTASPARFADGLSASAGFDVGGPVSRCRRIPVGGSVVYFEEPISDGPAAPRRRRIRGFLGRRIAVRPRKRIGGRHPLSGGTKSGGTKFAKTKKNHTTTNQWD